MLQASAIVAGIATVVYPYWVRCRRRGYMTKVRCSFDGCTPLKCGCCFNSVNHKPNCPEIISFQLRAYRLSHPPTTPMVVHSYQSNSVLKKTNK